MRHLSTSTLAALLLTLTGCDSETSSPADSGTAATSAGSSGEGGTVGTGATSGEGGSSGTGGTGATSGTGGSGGTGATGGSSGSGGSGGGAGTGGTGAISGTGGSSGTGATGGSGGSGTCAAASDCDDNIDCTADDCVATCCTHVIDATPCTSGQVCDLREGGCTASTPCGDDDDCMDSDPCTRNERCNLSAAACEWDMLDTDADGHAPTTCGGDDFDDADGTRYPCAAELCDGKDNDGDGSVDPEPLATASCGEFPRGSIHCEAGACVHTCELGFDDCDGEASNGCETDINWDPAHCGACGYSCATCENGLCASGACANAPDLEAYERTYRWDGFTAGITAIRDTCGSRCSGAEDRAACVFACIGEATNDAFTSGCATCLVEMSACRTSSGCGPYCDNTPGLNCLDCDCSHGCVDAFELCSGIEYAACL